ncbi:MAG TPA: ATP-grasp domain-containing protein [Bryobacteraceae bacterium]|jgi:carbamoyl-phosphate synthase large subunit
MKSPLTILLTGAGAPGTRGTLYALRAQAAARVRVVGADLRAEVAGRLLCDRFSLLPPPEDRSYLSQLIDLARREHVDAILPQTTREVAALAGWRDTLASEGLPVVVSSPESISLANDKHEVLKVFEALALPYPRYRLCTSAHELRDCAREFGYPHRPVVVKPPVSNGMRGFRVLRADCWDAARFFAEKPSGVECSLDQLLAILATAETWPPLLVTEHLPGPEYSVDAFAGAKARIAIPRRRAEIRSGISFATECERRPDLVETTLAAAERLGLRYAFGFQFKLDAEGVPKVLECNPRVQGTMAASVFAGANVIWMAVCEALGAPQKLQTSELRPYARFYRFWGGVGIGEDGQTREI